MSEVICFQFAGPFRESFSGDGIRTSQEEPCVGGDDWNYVDFSATTSASSRSDGDEWARA